MAFSTEVPACCTIPPPDDAPVDALHAIVQGWEPAIHLLSLTANQIAARLGWNATFVHDMIQSNLTAATDILQRQHAKYDRPPPDDRGWGGAGASSPVPAEKVVATRLEGIAEQYTRELAAPDPAPQLSPQPLEEEFGPHGLYDFVEEDEAAAPEPAPPPRPQPAPATAARVGERKSPRNEDFALAVAADPAPSESSAGPPPVLTQAQYDAGRTEMQ